MKLQTMLALLLLPTWLWAQCAGPTRLWLTPNPDLAHTPGVIAPGSLITACVEVQGYADPDLVNWLHGVVFTLGPGWEAGYASPTQVPTTCAPSGGQWGWYQQVFPAQGGVAGPGFFFDEDLNNFPGDNYGDDDIFNTCTGHTWQFCVQLKVRDDAPEGTDLNLSIRVTSDAETGAWLTGAGGCTEPPILPENTVPMQVGCAINSSAAVNADTLQTGQPLLITNLTTGAIAQTWDYGNGQTFVGASPPPFSYTTPGTYTLLLTATALNGCTHTWDTTITVKSLPPPPPPPKPTSLVLPTAFSPNADGLNDYWTTGQLNSEISLDIYDRWGSHVWHYTGTSPMWDGLHDGTFLPEGVYTLIAKYNNQLYTNSVQLIR